MGTRIQRLFIPGGSTATSDQGMTFQAFFPADKGPTPAFETHTVTRMVNPHTTESKIQRALEALNPNKPVLMGSFSKPLNP